MFVFLTVGCTECLCFQIFVAIIILIDSQDWQIKVNETTNF